MQRYSNHVLNPLVRETERAVLRHLEATWRNLGVTRPWGMWVTVHGLVPKELNALDLERFPALAAWFLDRNGLHSRSPWEFQRFWVVHFVQPWCSREFREQDGIFGAERCPIGIAAFAEYPATDSYYLELSYGKHFGRGYRLTVDRKGAVCEVELWRS